MSKRFEGKAALITGAARGQGRSHAVALAREGADIAICDIVEQIDTVPYGLSAPSDLEETKRLCEAEGANVVAERADVRKYAEVKAFADKAIDEFGQIHILIPNAGIFTFGTLTEMSEEMFNDMIDTNLRGCWHVIKAVVPNMAEHQYGRVVIIGSSSSLIGYPNVGHYTAAKHGVLGLTKSLAVEQAANGITVNCVCPTGVRTMMLENEAAWQLVNPDNPTREGAMQNFQLMNAIPRPWLEPEDVTKLVLFLASDDSMYMTGGEVKIDMGLTAT
jgi:SDR family mycofactocin-dependent oxidoreductase